MTNVSCCVQNSAHNSKDDSSQQPRPEGRGFTRRLDKQWLIFDTEEDYIRFLLEWSD